MLAYTYHYLVREIRLAGIVCYASFILTILSATMPVNAGEVAEWRTYQYGKELELALDLNALSIKKDGLIHFVNQERFARPQFDPHYQVDFAIRRLHGYVDCARARYALVSADFYSASNRLVWSSLFPLSRHAWQWKMARQDTVAHEMVIAVCRAAQSALLSRKIANALSPRLQFPR